MGIKETRPQKGRFRQQAEYGVWGSNGPMPISRPRPKSSRCSGMKSPRTVSHVTEAFAAYGKM